MALSTEAVARKLLRDIRPFSHLVLKVPLRGYQVEPVQAILRSVFEGQGLEFLLVFPRQSGKNEAIAQMLVYLMNLYQKRSRETDCVYGAVGDALGMGMRRLELRLENAWNRGQWSKRAGPDRRALGQAGVVFVSSHPSGSARGQTAHLLVVIDEAQEQDGAYVEAVFTPMRAAHNATAVYTGTVKTTSDFLWQKKRQLEALEREDGIRRVFAVTAEEVTEENPAYARFLAEQVARYGRHHPIVASEYFLEPMDGSGGLFDARRRTLMHGSHRRESAPRPGGVYVATLDVAGEDEGATDPLARLRNPARDYTACTVFEVVFPPAGRRAQGPTYHAVDVFVEQGTRHFAAGGRAPEEGGGGGGSLVERLAGYLDHWQVAHVVSDCTGVGQGVTSWLRAQLGEGRVTAYNFAGPKAKAELGAGFLALVETNRFRYFAEGGAEGEVPFGDAWWFFEQAGACAYDVPAEGTLEREMRWGVPAGHRTETPAGPVPTHDDRLVSAALVAEVDRLVREGKVALGTAHSAVIEARDALARPVY